METVNLYCRGIGEIRISFVYNEEEDQLLISEVTCTETGRPISENELSDYRAIELIKEAKNK